MAKKFGNIELGETFGGWEIVNAPADKLPQDLASAVGTLNEKNLGATFTPVWYVGSQIVNGTNHFLICEETRTTKNETVCIVGLVVNIPLDSVGGEGAEIVEVIERVTLPKEIQTAFDKAMKNFVGASYKPIAYIGSQVVKGVNHFILCQATGIYPNAKPYAAVVVINIFEEKATIAGISPVSSQTQENLFGYAFSW